MVRSNFDLVDQNNEWTEAPAEASKILKKSNVNKFRILLLPQVCDSFLIILVHRTKITAYHSVTSAVLIDWKWKTIGLASPTIKQ